MTIANKFVMACLLLLILRYDYKVLLKAMIVLLNFNFNNFTFIKYNSIHLENRLFPTLIYNLTMSQVGYITMSHVYATIRTKTFLFLIKQ